MQMTVSQNQAPGSIRAYIIHLERAAGRRAHAEKLTQTLPQQAAIESAEILPAVDARDLPERAQDAVYKTKLIRPHYPFALKPAEIACFLSHRKAWAALLDGGADAAFITEDDMRPRASFTESILLARRHIRQCGLIRFPHRDREKGRILAASGETELIRPRMVGLGAVAYMLSRDAASWLLEETAQFDRPLDVFLQMFWLSGIHPAAIRPSSVAEVSNELGGSTLTQRRGFGAKLRHEILRPLYRAEIAVLSAFKISKEHDR